MRILDLRGASLERATALWTSFQGWAVRDSNRPDAQRRWRLFTPPSSDCGIGAVRVASPSGLSDWELVLLDNLPVASQSSGNKHIETAQTVEPPASIEGHVTERAFDYYNVELEQGARLSVDVVAHRLGSALDPVLRILDSKGNELAYCDDDALSGADPRVTFQAPEAGSYFIELRDVRYQGGPNYHYRLRVGDFALDPISFLSAAATTHGAGERLPNQNEHEPNDQPAAANAIRVPARIIADFAKPRDRDFYVFDASKGTRLIFNAKTRSMGSPCDVYMRLLKPDGTVAVESNSAVPDEASVTNSFSEAGRYMLVVEELNRRGGPDLNYQLEVHPDRPGFDLSVETDKLTAPPGGKVELKVNVVRRDYSGPIALRLHGLDAAVISDHQIAEKANSTELKITVPEHFVPGQLLHFRVLGEAEIGGDPVRAAASTIAALRNQFPLMLYPPRALDGLIGLGVTEGAVSR